LRFETGPRGDGHSAGVDAIAAFCEEKIRMEGVPGLAIAVVKGDRLVWARGFGIADLATSTRATSQTSYLWFSMTKIATATAVVRLAEEGAIDLDAPADEYYRGFKVVSQPTPVSVRHLLSHSSGLANPVPIRWVYPASGLVPGRRAFVERLLGKNRKLRFVPGERASYSNLGYLVLGEVISEVSGMGYEDYVRERILLPLGMTRTGFSYPRTGRDAATGYHPLPPLLTPIFRAALPRGVVGSRQGKYVAFNPFYVKGPAYGGLVGGVEGRTGGGDAPALRGVRGRDAAYDSKGRQAGLRIGLVSRREGQGKASCFRRAPRRRGRILERDAPLPRRISWRGPDGQHYELRPRVHPGHGGGAHVGLKPTPHPTAGCMRCLLGRWFRR
jgi:CubicO group peptidase (beta-lactamase class C family)